MCAILYICYISQFLNLFIFSLPSGTCPRNETSFKFFGFLSNYRIVKLWKLISRLTGSVYLSKRSRKQTRGILIDCFPCTINVIVLLRDWILWLRFPIALRLFHKIGNIEQDFFEMSCSKQFLIAKLFSGNLNKCCLKFTFPKAVHFIA